MEILDSIDYYNQYANQYFENTVNLELDEILDDFITYLPEGAEIMDLGCGSGRDSLYFIEKGFDVTAVDGSSELSELAAIHIGQDVLTMKFNDLDFSNVFDGIWANASLFHIPPSELSEVMLKIHGSLKKGGILFMSFKYGDFEGNYEGRYFKYYRRKEIREMIENVDGLELLKIAKTTDIRPYRQEDTWIHIIAKKVN